MENNNSIEALRNSRMQMFEKMGIKNAGTMNESITESGAKNLTMAQKLQQIRSGAAKAEIGKFVSASSKPGASSVPGMEGFSPIPEVKPKNNSNRPQQPVNSNFKVALDDFGGGSSSRVDNSELSMIDAMFGGNSSPKLNSFDNGQNFMQQRPQDMTLDLDNTLGSMPSFNPQQALQRAQYQAQNQGQTQQNQGNSFLQFAQQRPAGAQEEYVMQNQQENPQAYSAGITPAMTMMMENIAKTMAEQTIKRVLTDFTENQKGKMFFEIYNKEKSIIKTADGKLYKLTPVQIKK